MPKNVYRSYSQKQSNTLISKNVCQSNSRKTGYQIHSRKSIYQPHSKKSLSVTFQKMPIGLFPENSLAVSFQKKVYQSHSRKQSIRIIPEKVSLF